MAEPDPMAQLEAGIMAALGASATAVSTDPELALLLPGGVHSRSAAEHETPYLTLVLVRMDEDHTFTGPWRWRFQYRLAVTDEAESIDASSAALERVYDLLHDANISMEDFTLGFGRRKGRTGITPIMAGSTVQRISDEYRFEVYPI